MNEFLESIIKRDPAAKSKLSIILTYPGAKAVFFHKIANFFAIAKFDLVARIVSQFSRFLTGIEIHPKARIGKILFEGNKKLSSRKLENMISLKQGDLLDESILKEDQNLISEKYLEKGYWNSSVDVSVDRGNGEVPVNILYKIVEGEKRTISKILFSGNEALDSKKLLKVMETAPWRFWRFWLFLLHFFSVQANFWTISQKSIWM